MLLSFPFTVLMQVAAAAKTALEAFLLLGSPQLPFPPQVSSIAMRCSGEVIAVAVVVNAVAAQNGSDGL